MLAGIAGVSVDLPLGFKVNIHGVATDVTLHVVALRHKDAPLGRKQVAHPASLWSGIADPS